MRRVTRFKRSTAPSKAWMPNARPQCCCQAPQPRSGAPKAQGLIAARWPQHNRLCRRSLPADAPTANNISTGADGSVALQLQSRISTNLTDVTLTHPSAVATADGVRSASGYATWDCCRHAIGFSTHEQSPYDPRRLLACATETSRGGRRLSLNCPTRSRIRTLCHSISLANSAASPAKPLQRR